MKKLTPDGGDSEVDHFCIPNRIGDRQPPFASEHRVLESPLDGFLIRGSG